MNSFSNTQMLAFQEQVTQYKASNQNNLIRLIRETYRQMTNGVNKRLTEIGYGDLSARHFSIFDHFDIEGTNIVTLAQRAGITKQAMSKLVKETTLSGYTVVKSDKKDSRISLVSLTPKGYTFLKVLHTEVSNFKDDLKETETLTQEDINITSKSLTRIISYLEFRCNSNLLN